MLTSFSKASQQTQTPPFQYSASPSAVKIKDADGDNDILENGWLLVRVQLATNMKCSRTPMLMDIRLKFKSNRRNAYSKKFMNSLPYPYVEKIWWYEVGTRWVPILPYYFQNDTPSGVWGTGIAYWCPWGFMWALVLSRLVSFKSGISYPYPYLASKPRVLPYPLTRVITSCKVSFSILTTTIWNICKGAHQGISQVLGVTKRGKCVWGRVIIKDF